MSLASLSADTKDALAREVPDADHCRRALLLGLALYGARSGGSFVTRRSAIARLVRALLTKTSAAPPTAGRPRATRAGEKRFSRTVSYTVPLPSLAQSAAKPVHKCDRVMEVRGAFLACGSLSAAPAGYHLEFVPPDESRAERLRWMLRAIGHAPKSMPRNHRTVLYFKHFETIVDLLTIVGAHGAVLRLEDVRALKETKNHMHRLVNTEAANLDRSAAAGAAHRQTIEYLSAAYGLHNLSRALREIAQLRLQFPDESLSELGRRCNPPIGKPTVNSRLLALARLAKRLRGAARERAAPQPSGNR